MSTTTGQTPATTATPLRIVGGILTVLLLAGMGGWAPAAAETPDEQGYWWRSPVLMADQSVPEGGLVVAGQPEGPLAVSALRFTLDDPDEMAASIHLEVASDTREGFIEEPLLWACPSDQSWQPTEDGDWDDAPGETCSPGIAQRGRIGEDGEYVFVVSQFIQNGQLDVMITPGVRGAVPSPLLLQLLNDTLVEQIGTGAPWPGPPTVDGLDGSNFRVTFEATDENTLRTGEDSADDSITSLEFDGSSEFGGDFGGDDGGDDFGGPGAGDDFGGDDGPSDASPPDLDSAPGSSGGGLGESSSPQSADPPETAGPGGDEAPGQEDGVEIQTEPPQTADAADEQAMGGATPAGTPGGLDPRVLGGLVLGLGALAAAALAMGIQGAGLAGLAGGSQSALGGLGQFARPRASRPPVL
jgi:hypothetical protein